MTARRPYIRCREIGQADIDSVADLLTRGFVGRSGEYWMRGLRRQATRGVPGNYPRFGYMLDNEGVPVGVLLLLYSVRDCIGEMTVNRRWAGTPYRLPKRALARFWCSSFH